jgi:hypothetical protein
MLPKPFVASLQIAPVHNPRLYAQQGLFLVTNVGDVEGFICSVIRNANQPELFKAVDVPIACAAEALRDLQYMGVTAATMFPGLEGIGRMLRQRILASSFR